MLEACGEEVACAYHLDNPLDWESPGIGRAAFFLLVQCGTYFLLIFLLESGLAKCLKQIFYSLAAVSQSTTYALNHVVRLQRNDELEYTAIRIRQRCRFF